MTVRPLALVTGASRGLGKALCEFLSADGYDLITVARGAEPLEAQAQGLSRLGGSVRSVVGDVSDPMVRQRLVDLVGRTGRLDILVNNASELGPSPLPALSDVELSEFRRVYEVNVLAPLALVQSTLPFLARAKGLVVNISSDAAEGAYVGWGIYGASKASLDLLSRTLAKELESTGVAVVVVDPGDMRTQMHQAAFPGQDISDRPLPEATLPFFAWLLGRDHPAISGRRYRAQAETWEVAAA